MLNIKHSDGRIFNVNFYSHMVENKVKKIVRETTCKLAIVDESKTGRDKYTDVAVGTVRKRNGEVDSSPIGREYAFGAAIKKWDKAERLKMWRQYNPTMKLEEVKAKAVKVDAVAGQVEQEVAVD